MTSVYSKNKLRKSKENDAWTKLFDLVPEKSAVLDVGCSSGNFGKELMRRKSCSVVGIDMNESDIREAMQKLNGASVVNIELDDLGHLGTFDVIIMADVIEHLIQPVEALLKLKTLIKPGGMLIFSVPNMANVATRLELLSGRFEYTEFGILDETHLHYYDRIQLELVFKGAGFSVKTYNNTVRDVPPEAAKALLSNLGLGIEDEERYKKALSDIDAISFQFIGVAVPKPGKHSKVASKTPHDFMSTYIDNIRNKAELVNRRSDKLRAENRQLKERLDGMAKELDGVYRSRAWQAVRGFRGLKRKVGLRKER